MWTYEQEFAKEAVCMKCQILFSEKECKNIIKFSFDGFAQRVVKVIIETIS